MRSAIVNYLSIGPLIKNIRFYVLLSSILLSIVIYIYVVLFTQENLRSLYLVQSYAFSSFTYLYFALLVGPLGRVFPRFPFKNGYTKARRSLGVSAFYFALLHSTISFFTQIGGLHGLLLLNNIYLTAITLSFSALIILFLLSATSFDFIIAKLTFPKWKKLHRLIYIGGIFILIHALLIGSHFAILSSLIPQLFFLALSILLILEAKAFDSYLARKYSFKPKIEYSLIISIIIIIWNSQYFW